MAEPITIDIIIKAKNQTMEGIKEATQGLEEVAKGAEAASRAVEKMEDPFKGIVAALGDVEKASRKVKDGLDGVKESGAKVKTGLDGVESFSGRTKRGLDDVEKSSRQARRTLKELAREKAMILLEAKDRLTSVLERVGKGLRGLTRKAWGITMRVTDLATAPIKGIFNLLRNPVVKIGETLGISLGIKDTVDTYGGFESAMSQVRVISGTDDGELAELTAKAKEMGASTKYTATESAEAFNYMAMAGWESKDMLEGIEGIMSLAAVSGEELGTTSDFVTDALTAFGLKAGESGHFADVLAQASAKANTNVGLMGESFKYVAPVAGALGYEIEDVSLALGLMANSSVKGSMAGTSLKTSLSNMAAPTKEMASAMKQYQISLKDSKGETKSLKEVMDNLRGSLGGLSETEQTAAASTIFGKDAMAGMLAIINASEEDYDKLTEAVYHAEGASEQMADTMMDNLSGSLTLLQGMADGVKLAFGERLKPYIQGLAVWLKDMMPDIEKGLDHFMDYVDEKIGQLKDKVADFTGTKEWENADFFGKIEIAWDELIADPFAEWWESTGRQKISDAAANMGDLIGTGLNRGIMALLGVGDDGVMEEGLSAGATFVDGFLKGFEPEKIKKAVLDAMKGIFSDSYFGGGDGVLSTLLVGAVGLKGLGAGAQVGKGIADTYSTIKILGGLFKPATVPGIPGTPAMPGAPGVPALPGPVAGPVVAGGGLSTISLGAGIGGAIGGAAIISGGMDLYNGYRANKEGNKEEAAAYAKSGIWKAGGVATGAAIGSLILPGIGTLLGAGIGGITGWIQGDSVMKEYKKSLKVAQEAAEAAALAEEQAAQATALAEEQAKYESRELKDALADTSMTAEEFSRKFQKAVGKNLKNHFGDIKLSMQEVRNLADKIVFDGHIDEIANFSAAVTSAQNSLAVLQDTLMTTDRWNWKASLGMEFSDTEIEGFKANMDSLINSTKSYIENQHYEAEVAFKLLVGEESSIDMTTGLDQVYATIQEQLEGLGGELKGKVDIALEDGVITLDEQAEIMKLQNQITEITQKLSDAQTEATFQKLGIKYSGSALDSESFSQLQLEIQEEVKGLNQSYDEALEVGITGLNLELAEGVIDQEQYDEQLQALTEGYQGKIDSLQVRVESFQLDTIAEVYSQELDGILPNIEGSTSEKLGTALHRAITSGVDATTWDTETASKWLGLDGLGKETQEAVAELMSQVAATIPESTLKSFEDVDFVAPLFKELRAQMATVDLTMALDPLKGSIQAGLLAGMAALDYSGVGLQVGSGLGSSISDMDMEPINSATRDLKSDTEVAIDTAFAAGFDITMPVRVTADYELLNPLATINLSGVSEKPTKSVSLIAGVHATGGLVNSAELSWIGEDGPEAIIPLSGKYRRRGLELYEQAGRFLGVGYNAEGGVYNTATYAAPAAVSGNTAISNMEQSTVIQVTASPQTQVKIDRGSSLDEIMDTLRQSWAGVTDQMLAEIAQKILLSFENMPGMV